MANSAFSELAPDDKFAVSRNDAAKPNFALMNDMIVERGDKSDWDLLSDLHYKTGGLPMGPHFWKLTLYGETIGVLITAVPKGMLRERHLMFPNISPGAKNTKFTNTNRYHYINRNFRVVSRFVIDTMYRGIGLGYRMMNLVARMEGNTFTEIQSSMSKFNSFGQKAGFKFIKPLNANHYEKGMKFFRSRFESTPQDFEAIVNELEAMPAALQQRTLAECKDWYLKNSAQENTGSRREGAVERVAAMSARAIIKAIQQVSLASPMYGVYQCPDAKDGVPDVLPILAFDQQKPHEKLRLDLLDA